MSKIKALLAGAAAIAGGVVIARRIAALRPKVVRVAPDLRSPLLYAFSHEDNGTPPARRGFGEALMSRAPAGLGERITLPARDGAPAVAAYRYEAADRRRPSGALLWIHGGGMIGGSPPMDHGLCSKIARELGLLVLSVDYRLAPEDPFPAGPQDCYTGLDWLHGHAKELGIDPGRIAVGGASAGGGLAAMVSQIAQDRGLPVAFQLLIYPMLDDRTVLETDHQHRGELIWTQSKNASAWAMFLGHPVRAEEERPYASAARRADLGGQPPAWIGVGDLDLFYTEDLAYAERLEHAGVDVELVVMDGMPHGMDFLAWVPRMKTFRQAAVDALGRALA